MSEHHDLDLASIRASLTGASGPEYWRSLEELADTDAFQEFLHREFPAQASEFTDPVGRRQFLRLMGASLALAGVTACTKQPAEAIVPYVRAPEEIVPGKPLFFATAMPLGGVRDGRAGREPRGAADEDRGQPRAPGQPRRDGRLRPGLDPGALRPGPVADADAAGRHPHRGARSSARSAAWSRPSAPAQGAGLRILTEHGDLAHAGAADGGVPGGVPGGEVAPVRGRRPRQRARRRAAGVRRRRRHALRVRQGARRRLARRRLPGRRCPGSVRYTRDFAAAPARARRDRRR